MQSTTFRFHVQTTANQTREDFPYFAHHDSISALWENKWRRPCSLGIYPFVDGKVEDFDPIFRDLIARSNDDPSFLEQPDDYAEAFFAPAETLSGSAEDAAAAGELDKARDLYLRAAAIYRIARFPINRSRLTDAAWARGKAAYEKGGALFEAANLALDVPFEHVDSAAGDQDVAIKAYLRVPVGNRPKNGWPLLLFICGLDAYRTDNTSRNQTHLDHGFAVLSFEIPGTGDCPAASNDPTSPDRLISSVLDWAHANADQCGLDAARILARGISTGGYYAMRAAHTHGDQLFAVAAQGGGAHHMFDPGWIAAQNQMEYPFALADALAWKFGYRDENLETARSQYIANAGKFSLLNSGILARQSCRLLVINGMEDTIFPIEDSFLAVRHGRGKDLLVRGNLSHMGNPGGEEIAAGWLRDQIAA
jgi:predicted peptidase